MFGHEFSSGHLGLCSCGLESFRVIHTMPDSHLVDCNIEHTSCISILQYVACEKKKIGGDIRGNSFSPDAPVCVFQSQEHRSLVAYLC